MPKLELPPIHQIMGGGKVRLMDTQGRICCEVSRAMDVEGEVNLGMYKRYRQLNHK